jgi:tripartite-type tricarboxylate transporter receptor subunit TctC
MDRDRASLNHRRRRIVRAGAAVAVLLPVRALAQSGEASTYPDRPITLYCPWAPGGPTDITMRALADSMSKILPRRVIIDNRPGAGGALAAAARAERETDDYTLTQTPLSFGCRT